MGVSAVAGGNGGVSGHPPCSCCIANCRFGRAGDEPQLVPVDAPVHDGGSTWHTRTARSWVPAAAARLNWEQLWASKDHTHRDGKHQQRRRHVQCHPLRWHRRSTSGASQGAKEPLCSIAAQATWLIFYESGCIGRIGLSFYIFSAKMPKRWMSSQVTLQQ